MKTLCVSGIHVDLKQFKNVGLDGLRGMEEPISFVPFHMRDGLLRYLEFGIMPGGFLEALINNDLKTTYARADHINTLKIREYLVWLMNYAPSDSWGYGGATQFWQKHTAGLRTDLREGVYNTAKG